MKTRVRILSGLFIFLVLILTSIFKNSLTKKRKWIVIGAVLICALAFTSCRAETIEPLQITFISPYVDYDGAMNYGETIVLNDETQPIYVKIDNISHITSNNDVIAVSSEMTGNIGFMRVIAEISAKSIDVIVCDYQNGARFSTLDAFMPLNEIFSQDELKSLDSSLFVEYQEIDEYGEFTGNMLPYMGLDVSHINEFTQFMNEDYLVCHIISNTENIDNSKEYMLSLIF